MRYNNCFFILFLMFFLPSLFISSPYYDRIEYVKDIVRYEGSFKIKIYKKINKEDLIFNNHYWKIYYLNDKIVAEELYQKGKLVYYYWYYYTKDKVYQKGYFWNGIYMDIVYFKAHEKYIKQGWSYNNIPDVYRVYDSETGSVIYEHIYNLSGISK